MNNLLQRLQSIGVKPPSRDWRLATGCFALLLVLQLICLWAGWNSFLEAWERLDFSHGWLILPISTWLALRDRHKLAGLKPQWSALGILGVLGSIILWAIGHATSTSVVMQAGVIGCLIFTVLAVFGLKVGRVLWFPLAFLLFMLPVGSWLSGSLIEGTAGAIEGFVRLLGIPIYREGPNLVLTSGRWSVIAACSGLRYLITALVLASLFAYLNFNRLGRGLLFIAIALAASIFSNWLRAIIIVLTGHVTDMRYGTGVEHLWLGWIFFGIVISLVFWMGTKWRDAPEDQTTQQALVAESPAAPVTAQRPAGTYIATAVIAAMLVILPLLTAAWTSTTPHPVSATWATGNNGLTQVDKLVYEPNFDGAVAVRRIASAATRSSGVIGYWANQGQRGAMIRMRNAVVPDEEESPWRVNSTEHVKFTAANQREVDAIRLSLSSNEASLGLMYWYTVNGKITSNPYTAKLWQFESLLSGKGDHSTTTIILTQNRDARTRSWVFDQDLVSQMLAASDQVLGGAGKPENKESAK